MKKLTITFILFSLLVLSCKKAENSVKVFSGITERTVNGELLSNDSDDWNLSEIWIEQEENLFTEQYTNSCVSSTSSFSIAAYPNPCDGRIYFHINKPETARFVFIVVDNQYNEIVSQEVTTSSVAINFDMLNIENKTLRVYYKFLGENCELKGHGDIKVN